MGQCLVLEPPRPAIGGTSSSTAQPQGMKTPEVEAQKHGQRMWLCCNFLQEMTCAACSGRGHGLGTTTISGVHRLHGCAARQHGAPACPQGARAAALEATNSNGGRIPPFPGLRQRIPSSTRLSEMGAPAVGSPGTSATPAGGDARGQPAPASRLRRSSGLSEDGTPMAGAAELQQGAPLHQQVRCLIAHAPCLTGWAAWWSAGGSAVVTAASPGAPPTATHCLLTAWAGTASRGAAEVAAPAGLYLNQSMLPADWLLLARGWQGSAFDRQTCLTRALALCCWSTSLRRQCAACRSDQLLTGRDCCTGELVECAAARLGMLIDPTYCSLTGRVQAAAEQNSWQQALMHPGTPCHEPNASLLTTKIFQQCICRVQGPGSERSSTELDRLRQPGAGPAAEAGRLGEMQTPSALRSNVLG